MNKEVLSDSGMEPQSFYFRKEEREKLRAYAAAHQKTLISVVREHLSPVFHDTPDEAPAARLRRLALAYRDEVLREQRAVLEADLAKATARMHEHKTTPLRRLFESDVISLKQRIDLIDRRLATTTTALAIPLVLGLTGPTVLAAGAAALVLFFAAQRWVFPLLRGRLGRLLPSRAGDTLTRGPDAGAPNPSKRVTLEPGYNLAEVAKRFRELPAFVRDHVQDFLDQEDGLEKLRVLCEDSVFEAVEEEADNGKEQRNVRARLLVCTEDQLDQVPPDVIAMLMSRRSRPLVRAMGTEDGKARGGGTVRRRITPLAPDASASPSHNGNGGLLG